MSRAAARTTGARERLTTTLLLMALLHGIVLLGVGFGVGGDTRVPSTLDVLLVSEDQLASDENATARYLAQRTQKGTGNASSGATSTPDISEPEPDQPPPEPTGESQVLATALPQPDTVYAGAAERQMNVGAEPRTPLQGQAAEGRGARDELRLIGDAVTGQWLSPDTRASDLAPYLDRWRRRVERLGTLNYPAIARARNARAPIIEVALRADGVLLESDIKRSSGDPALDEAALQILKAASPFTAFPPGLANRYRVLRFAYQWEFSVTATPEAAAGP